MMRAPSALNRTTGPAPTTADCEGVRFTGPSDPGSHNHADPSAQPQTNSAVRGLALIANIGAPPGHGTLRTSWPVARSQIRAPPAPEPLATANRPSAVTATPETAPTVLPS